MGITMGMFVEYHFNIFRMMKICFLIRKIVAKNLSDEVVNQ